MDEKNNQSKIHFTLTSDDKSSTSSNITKVLLLFNFCPHPLDKTNIIKINIEMLDKYLLKDALSKAIQILNSTHENKIIDKTEKYKIRLSKKSGLPDVDIPSIQEALKLSELNFLNYSIIIEQEHLLILPRKKYDPSKDQIPSTSKQSFSSSTRALNFDLKLSDKMMISNEESQRKKKRNCCSCCCDFFNQLFGGRKSN